MAADSPMVSSQREGLDQPGAHNRPRAPVNQACGSGQELADLPAAAGADDTFYDAELRSIYLIAGWGEIDTYQMDESKNVRAAGVVRTSAGARTRLLVLPLQTLFIGL